MKLDGKKVKLQNKYKEKIKKKQNAKHTKEVLLVSVSILIILFLYILFGDSFYEPIPKPTIEIEQVE
jgi:uncharacterized membrane protein